MGIHALGDGIFLGVEVAEDGCPADFGRIGDATVAPARPTLATNRAAAAMRRRIATLAFGERPATDIRPLLRESAPRGRDIV
jgi:hypothetical protein